MTFDCSDSSWADITPEESLVFTWSLDKMGAAGALESVSLLPEPSAVLTLPANFLGVATYKVTCSVSNAAGGNKAAASVQVSVESNEVPAVAVGTVDGGSKYGAGSKIRLNSTVSLPSDPSAVFTLAWSVASSGTKLDLASAAVTTTGASQPNLVVRANVLQAGVEYTFKLTATYPGQNPGESTTKVAISTPPRGGRIEVRDSATKKETTTGFELDTNFTLSAPSWTGEGNLYYTYVAVDASGAETILGHGQKKTTLSGVILNKGKMTLNVIVADAFGAEGRTSVPAQSGGSTGATVTIEAKAVSAAAADNLIGNALGAAKSGKVG